MAVEHFADEMKGKMFSMYILLLSLEPMRIGGVRRTTVLHTLRAPRRSLAVQPTIHDPRGACSHMHARYTVLRFSVGPRQRVNQESRKMMQF